jgi:hypothetical protein
MIALPIAYTVLTGIVVFSCLVLVANGGAKVVTTPNDVINGFFISLLCTGMFAVVEGHFGPWTTVYVVSSVIGLWIQIARGFGAIRVGTLYLAFGAIEGMFWIWAIWHLYGMR